MPSYANTIEAWVGARGWLAENLFSRFDWNARDGQQSFSLAASFVYLNILTLLEPGVQPEYHGLI